MQSAGPIITVNYNYKLNILNFLSWIYTLPILAVVQPSPNLDIELL